MARLLLVLLSIVFMTSARPADPEVSPPAPAAGTPAPASGNSQNINQGIFVNGFNCTSYISQCKSGSQQLNNGTNQVPVTPTPDQQAQAQQVQGQVANNTNVCENAQAQTMCGGFTNNPISNNFQNSTIFNQNQNFTQFQNQIPITAPPSMPMTLPNTMPPNIPFVPGNKPSQ